MANEGGVFSLNQTLTLLAADPDGTTVTSDVANITGSGVLTSFHVRVGNLVGGGGSGRLSRASIRLIIDGETNDMNIAEITSVDVITALGIFGLSFIDGGALPQTFGEIKLVKVDTTGSGILTAAFNTEIGFGSTLIVRVVWLLVTQGSSAPGNSTVRFESTAIVSVP